ncbi:unnamed protein product [Allacma fusca]|uniref:Uncharacterized protein n=1 Tax=Allacma fusca TaxID=39272 RepID=A0A8J2KK98_9HEXA|nr:unnamed protein product [Allacma fusca]
MEDSRENDEKLSGLSDSRRSRNINHSLHITMWIPMFTLGTKSSFEASLLKVFSSLVFNFWGNVEYSYALLDLGVVAYPPKKSSCNVRTRDFGESGKKCLCVLSSSLTLLHPVYLVCFESILLVCLQFPI